MADIVAGISRISKYGFVMRGDGELEKERKRTREGGIEGEKKRGKVGREREKERKKER